MLSSQIKQYIWEVWNILSTFTLMSRFCSDPVIRVLYYFYTSNAAQLYKAEIQYLFTLQVSR